MNLQTPPNWRKGQTIFNFLEWLGQQHGYSNAQSPRMADPFHIPDEALEALFKQFLEEHS